MYHDLRKQITSTIAVDHLSLEQPPPPHSRSKQGEPRLVLKLASKHTTPLNFNLSQSIIFWIILAKVSNLKLKQ